MFQVPCVERVGPGMTITNVGTARHLCNCSLYINICTLTIVVPGKTLFVGMEITSPNGIYIYHAVNNKQEFRGRFAVGR